jgi:hypothetical protein
MNDNNIKNLINLIKVNRGFTCALSGIPVKFDSGYMVAVDNSLEIKIKNVNFRKLKQSIFDILQKLESKKYSRNNEKFLGGWIDERTGIFYLDISYNIKSLVEAKRAAIHRAQLGIYDCLNNKTILVQ